MKMFRMAMATGLAVMLSAALQAGEVNVKGTHLCCGMCEKDVLATLEKVEGVSGVKCDRKQQLIVFKTDDAQSAAAAIEALAKAGFGGKATHDGQAVKSPETGAKAGQKSDSITFTGVHLCCGACVNAIKKITSDIPGAQGVEADRQAKTVTFTGKDIDAAAAADALAKHGFHGTVK